MSKLKRLEALVDNAEEFNQQIKGISCGLTGIEFSTQPRAMMGLKAGKTAVSLNNPQVEIYSNGFNIPMGQSTYKVMGIDGIIKRIYIHNHNRRYIVVENDGRLSTVEVTTYVGDGYGFELIYTDTLLNLQEGDLLSKSDILAESVAGMAGAYTNSVNLTSLAGTYLSTIEDSCWISETGSKMLEATVYKETSIDLTPNEVLLYLYGTPDNPQPFPEIGEEIRNDGVIAGKRKIKNSLASLDTTSLKQISDSDSLIYAPGGVLIDINIYKRVSKTHPNLKVIEEDEKLKDFFWELVQDRDISMYDSVSIINAITAINNDVVGKTTFRNKPLNLKIVFTYKLIIRPTVKSKLTGFYGNKTIVGGVIPDELCPKLPDGSIVHYGYSVGSVGNRNNSPVTTIPGLAQVCRQVRNKVREMFNVDVNGLSFEEAEYFGIDESIMAEANEYIVNFLELIKSPTLTAYINSSYEEMVELYMSILTDEFRAIHNEGHSIAIILQSLKGTPYELQKLELRGQFHMADEFIFEEKMSVGVTPILFLDKLGLTTHAVTTPHVNDLGLITHGNKKNSPNLFKSVKFFDPSATRSLNAYGEAEAVINFIELGKNPELRKQVYENLLNSKTTNMERIFDRNKVPFNSDPFQQMMESVANTMGFTYAFKGCDYVENEKFYPENSIHEFQSNQIKDLDED